MLMTRIEAEELVVVVVTRTVAAPVEGIFLDYLSGFLSSSQSQGKRRKDRSNTNVSRSLE